MAASKNNAGPSNGTAKQEEKEEEVWFDGVSKKLLQVHSKEKNLIEGDDRTLVTNNALSLLPSHAKTNRPNTIRPNTGLTEELAIDCEMVECYHSKSVLARVSIVNLFGHPILDKYVAPPAQVTDYRTRYSGIRRKDLVDAPSFETVQEEVAKLLKGRIIVGHALHNDFAVLKLSHPPDKIRDTSHHFRYLFQGKTPSLKKLCESVLGIKIQKGEHDSVQDAQATMKLYVQERDRWNQKLASNPQTRKTHQGRAKKSSKTKGHTKPKKKKNKTFYVMTT